MKKIPEILSISDFRKNIAGYVGNIIRSGALFIGSGGKVNAVLVSPSEYNDIPDAFALRSMQSFVVAGESKIIHDAMLHKAGKSITYMLGLEPRLETILRWMWSRSDQEETYFFMGEFLAAIRSKMNYDSNGNYMSDPICEVPYDDFEKLISNTIFFIGKEEKEQWMLNIRNNITKYYGSALESV